MTSQIHIQGITTDPALRAQHVLRDRGDELLAELAAKVALATELQVALVDWGEARDGLLRLCAQRVVRYLLATDTLA
ncbi:MAG: DUF2249 domain-containing protein, partial [Acidimicrobiales bacterium]